MLSRRFWEYVGRHRREYYWGYAAVVASIFMAQLSPWALKLAVDGVRRGASSGRLLVYAGALILLAAFEAAFNYAMRLRILGAALAVETERCASIANIEDSNGKSRKSQTRRMTRSVSLTSSAYGTSRICSGKADCQCFIKRRYWLWNSASSRCA